MKNFKELSEFLDTASLAERHNYLKSAPVFHQGVVHALDGNHSFLTQAAQNSWDDYLAFVSEFYHDNGAKILLFNDLNLFTYLLKHQHHSLVQTYHNIHQVENNHIFNCLSNLGATWELELELDKNNPCLHESLRPYQYLIPLTINIECEELKLLSGVLDKISLELYIVDNKFATRIKPKEEVNVTEQRQSWLNQISLIIASLNPEPSKYLGVALALGISVLAAPEAQAGAKDAKEYLQRIDKALSQIEVPAGCQMGAKILSVNGIGMTYEIRLGDYVVRTDFHKVGHISERTEQITYQLKEQKGCGLSKADAIEMATKMDKNVMKLWAGIK
jgi:hypothetical protein